MTKKISIQNESVPDRFASQSEAGRSGEKKMKRKLTGLVVSDKMQKTRVVAITRLKKHPKYLKYYKTTAKFKAHDENNEYRTGDKVIIEETRPLSRDKRWTIVALLEKKMVRQNSPQEESEIK